MEELMKKAAKFLQDNPNINEVELSDGFGNKVRMVRNSPLYYYPATQTYQYNPFLFDITHPQP